MKDIKITGKRRFLFGLWCVTCVCLVEAFFGPWSVHGFTALSVVAGLFYGERIKNGNGDQA